MVYLSVWRIVANARGHSEGVFMSLYKVDNVMVEGCTFIEATYDGASFGFNGWSLCDFYETILFLRVVVLQLELIQRAVQLSNATHASWGCHG